MVRLDNYNLWQFEQFKAHIGDKVLEIGCGLGNLTKYIKNDIRFLLSVDIKKEAVELTRSRLPENKNFHIELLNVFTDGLKKYSKIPFDTIIFSNVLEHIEDDKGALNKCYKILRKSGGKLLLLVPAHKFLYGTLDKEAGHYRRYNKKEINKLAVLTGFKILKIYYFNIIGALGWYINYCLLKKVNTNNTQSSSQISLYDKFLVKPDRWIENMINPPFGISVIAIMEAKK